MPRARTTPEDDWDFYDRACSTATIRDRVTSRPSSIIQLGEQLGFDSAWVRHRHFQYGISSPVAILAAATQRTRRIELGTAVIPARLGEPATAGRGPGDGRHPVRRPAQPRHQRRTADALRAGEGVAVSGHRRHRGLQLRAGRTTARLHRSGDTASAPSAASRASRCSPTGSSRTPPTLREPTLVRRRQPAFGPVGRRARG